MEYEDGAIVVAVVIFSILVGIFVAMLFRDSEAEDKVVCEFDTLQSSTEEWYSLKTCDGEVVDVVRLGFKEN